MVGGNNSYSGRVEVYTMDDWGTVCDDRWQLNDASVACRQLGFPYGASEAISEFGGGTGPIWLDDLNCGTGANSLFDCPSPTGVGTHNCDHSEDAGAVCIPVRKFEMF